uniref:Copine domain-containing protein n=1 Tax=Syphacia muris TaxID=451379 RepID=A0A0N5AJF1_9BILA
MVRIRHIIEMRRALKAPPLLPPKIKRDLKIELFTSSQLICLFYESSGGANGPWNLQTSTDVLDKNAEIDLHGAFAIEYSFEKTQYIKVDICDFFEEDTMPIGSTVFSVSEVICSPSPFTASIASETNGEVIGCVNISSRPRPKQKQVILQFCGKNIPKKSMFDGAQICFQVYRIEDNGEKTSIYKSELLKYALKINWRQFSLHHRTVADTNYRKIEVECYWKAEGKQVFIGQFTTDWDQLQASSSQQIQLFLRKEKNGKKSTGYFEVSRCNKISISTFLDYITSGASVELAVVVDFSTPYFTNVDDAFIEEAVFAIRTVGEQIRGYTRMAENMRKRENITYPQYFIVLILTRGFIDDLKETVQAIIFGSRAPISIVFVGIGDGDLSELERLGMAGCRLIYQNRRIDRDMMQFINQTSIRNTEDLQLEDIKDTINEMALCQIPWQMARWMMKNGIKPEKSLQQAQEDDYESEQLAPSTASFIRPRIAAIRYDSIIATLSDSDDTDSSPTTSNIFSSSVFDRTTTSELSAGTEGF